MIKKKKTILVAHRGGAALELENTEKAFDRALKEPIDGLECDLQLSSDGVPVLFHDRSLAKFSKPGKRLKQFSWEELQALKKHNYKKWIISGQKLLSYESFLSKYRKQSQLFIELKSRTGDRADGTSKALLEKMIKVHRVHTPLKKDTHFMSFDLELMKLAKKKLKDYKLIPLTEDPETFSTLKKEEFWGVGFPVRKVNASLVEKFHEKDMKVLVYTCNGPRQLKKVTDAGVDVMVSDRPDWICEAFRRLS